MTDKIKCPGCGKSVPDLPEGSTVDQLLCNGCFKKAELRPTPQADHCPRCGSNAINWNGYDWVSDRNVSNDGWCTRCGLDFVQWSALVHDEQRVKIDVGDEFERVESELVIPLPGEPSALEVALVAALQKNLCRLEEDCTSMWDCLDKSDVVEVEQATAYSADLEELRKLLKKAMEVCLLVADGRYELPEEIEEKP